MKRLASAAWLGIALCSLKAHAASPATSPVSYRVDESKPSRHVSIQAVSVDAVGGMSRRSVSQVNAALRAAAAGFARESRQCGVAAQGHPWEYRVTFDKALLSENYLSMVFAKTTVCAGSPNEQKEARVFALKTGAMLPSHALFRQMLPAANIVSTLSNNKEWIRLDEETAGTMIDDSKSVLGIDDERCDFYLKNTSYRIWVDGRNLILFPEFIQPNSFCQKEYLIQAR